MQHNMYTGRNRGVALYLLLEVVDPELLRLEGLVEDVLLLEVGPRLGDVALEALL